MLTAVEDFADAFESRLSGDLMAGPRSTVIGHPALERLRRVWERYEDVEREQRKAAEFSCGVVALDSQGIIRQINGRAVNLLGFDNAGELVSCDVRGIVASAAVVDALIETLEVPSSTPKSVPYSFERQSGEVFLELSVGPHAEPFECTILVIDVTTRVLLERELRRAHDLALAHERRTAEFLANMSHELRTPMNGVIGLVGLLRDTKLDLEQLELVHLMRRSGEHLLCIINDILDLAKLDAGHVTLDPVEVELEVLLRETVAAHEPLVGSKQVVLSLEIEGDVPYTCVLDPLRFRQVLNNLVGNAVKFTDTGRVSVRCATTPEGLLRIAVQDTGIGIRDEDVSKLFEPFAQGDTGATRRHEGTGLGLTISRRLVACLGGELGAHGKPNQGSTFWFTLPIIGACGTLREHYAGAEPQRVGVICDAGLLAELRSTFSILNWVPVELDMHDLERAPVGLSCVLVQAEHVETPLLLTLPERLGVSAKNMCLVASLRDPKRDTARIAGLRSTGRVFSLHDLRALTLTSLQQTQSPSEAASAPLQGVVVLVVEDNVVNQKVVARLLEKAGASVRVVSDGAQAVEAVHTHADIDLVLMDCQMPVMDGFDATRLIREHFPSLPVCALTANSIRGDKERCFSVGMNDYLTKPIQQEALVNTVRAWAGGG